MCGKKRISLAIALVLQQKESQHVEIHCTVKRFLVEVLVKLFVFLKDSNERNYTGSFLEHSEIQIRNVEITEERGPLA